MNKTPVQLGPFSLLARIGKGGMGTVWRGRHNALDAQAAIKVVTAERARDPRALAAFRREVQAAAGLEHPGIIAIFDYGQVNDTAAQASDGQFVAGSPFLAMELSTGRTLRDLSAMDWARLRDILLQVLDALAHAHARGVIHRDLKPDNVLLEAEEPQVLVRLSDFGIAHSMKSKASPDKKGTTAGTPSYMAPEQLQALWRNYGPWTDLYALGCMAFELATTQRPFVRDSVNQVAEAHIYDPRPPVDAVFPVPDSFERWVHQLMAIDPNERFRCAADAAWALMRMPDLEQEPAKVDGLGQGTSSRPLMTMANLHGEAVQQRDSQPEGLWAVSGESHTPPGTQFSEAARMESAVNLQPIATLEAADIKPPVPTSWRRLDHRRDAELVGAGLGLYGLRPVPFVDREQARDAIWATLREVSRERQTEIIVLRGAGGIGKRRLAQWMGERAHELGAAQVLETRLGPDAVDADGVPNLIAQHLGCVGLARKATFSRARRFFEKADVVLKDKHILALAQIIASEPDGPAEAKLPRIRLANPAVKHVLLRRVLDVACRDRPVMLCINEVQWAPDAITFVEHLLEWQKGAPLPLLIVLTANTDQIGDAPGVMARLNELSRHEAVTLFDLAPLHEVDHRELVDKLLHLAPELAERIAARTRGNPLFAVQMVGEWIQRDALELHSSGFMLRPGLDEELPENLHAVWLERIRGLARPLECDEDEILLALEVAAALGSAVDAGQWQQVTGALGLQIPGGLADELFESGMADRVPDRRDSWRFAHGMLRETLEATAREHERWDEIQRECAQLLRGRFDLEKPDLVRRLAHHVLESGNTNEATGLLLHAARQFAQTGELGACNRALDRREDVLMDTGVPMSSTAWLEGWLVRADAQLRGEEPEMALQAIQQAAAHVQQHDQSNTAALLHLQGRVARQLGDTAAAMQSLEQAIQLYHHLGEKLALARALNSVGSLYAERGNDEQAAMYFEGAIDLLGHQGDSAAEVGTSAESLTGLAEVCIRLGDRRQAAELLERAGSWFDHAGDRLGGARAATLRAQLASDSGDHDLAKAGYEQAVERLEEVGAQQTLASVLTQLAGTLDVLGKGSEATALRARAARLSA